MATGNAFRGPWRMNESTFDFVDDPTVALMADGDAAVAWVDQARKDVLFQRYGPEGSQQGLLMRKLATRPGGRSAVVNSKFRRGDASRVRLYPGRSNVDSWGQ